MFKVNNKDTRTTSVTTHLWMDEVAVFRAIQMFLIRSNLTFELVKFGQFKIKATKLLQKMISKRRKGK